MRRTGSPPRVRGTEPVWLPACRHTWITPARAGNSFAEGWHGRISGDHPRACGEQAAPPAPMPFMRGSPPRVRGTDTVFWFSMYFLRITPARAGNSDTLQMDLCKDWDHPRACGEQDILSALYSKSIGSPPRVRGTAFHGIVAHRLFGITPARAGNRASCNADLPTVQDHPRACGEQFPNAVATFWQPGSPPRVRGTVAFYPLSRILQRITPARAGNRLFCLDR